MSRPPAKPPEILDKIVDLVLAHRPKPKKEKKENHKNSTRNLAHKKTMVRKKETKQ